MDQDNAVKKVKKIEKNNIAFQGGLYSVAITLIVLAIMVAVNLLVSALPSNLTKYDISATKLFSITSNTKVVVNALDQDVTIYWIVQSGEEDEIITNLLGKYEGLSDHIKVVKKNPDIYPTFAQQYTSESIQNNSLVVECGDKYRFIAYDDIYLSEANMASYSYDRSFDGEGAITSAIDYVTTEEQPQLYMLEGHGEAELSTAFKDQIQKENIDLNTLSLLTRDEIPEDADCILIYGPSSDISVEEKDILVDYVKNGGKLMVLAGQTEDGTLKNLYSVLEEYSVEVVEGIAVESSRENYAFQSPHILLPTIESNEITAPLLEEKNYVIMPITQGMKITSTSNSKVTPLLTTSDTSFSKVDGYKLKTYEKEENDIDGPFTVALSIEADKDGKMIWISSSNFLDDMYNSYSSGANLDFAMNGLSALIGENEAVAIRSKSLNYNYLTISDSTASLLKTVMIGAFPMMYVAAGLIVVIRRRARNEAC